MKFKVIVHKAEEGGYWAEVPAIPGCATQGDTFEEVAEQPLRGRRRLRQHLMKPAGYFHEINGNDRTVEIAV